MFLVPTRPPVARTTVRDLLGACPDGEDEDAAERFITSAPRPGDAAAAIRAGGDMVDSTTIVLSRVMTTAATTSSLRFVGDDGSRTRRTAAFLVRRLNVN
jgi:hypothetical protein